MSALRINYPITHQQRVVLIRRLICLRLVSVIFENLKINILNKKNLTRTIPVTCVPFLGPIFVRYFVVEEKKVKENEKNRLTTRQHFKLSKLLIKSSVPREHTLHRS